MVFCLNITFQHYRLNTQLVEFRPFQIRYLAESHPSMQIRIATGLLYLVPVGRASAGHLVQSQLLSMQHILPLLCLLWSLFFYRGRDCSAPAWQQLHGNSKSVWHYWGASKDADIRYWSGAGLSMVCAEITHSTDERCHWEKCLWHSRKLYSYLCIMESQFSFTL